jgi:hypothetical protein
VTWNAGLWFSDRVSHRCFCVHRTVRLSDTVWTRCHCHHEYRSPVGRSGLFTSYRIQSLKPCVSKIASSGQLRDIIAFRAEHLLGRQPFLCTCVTCCSPKGAAGTQKGGASSEVKVAVDRLYLLCVLVHDLVTLCLYVYNRLAIVWRAHRYTSAILYGSINVPVHRCTLAGLLTSARCLYRSDQHTALCKGVLQLGRDCSCGLPAERQAYCSLPRAWLCSLRIACQWVRPAWPR